MHGGFSFSKWVPNECDVQGTVVNLVDQPKEVC